MRRLRCPLAALVVLLSAGCRTASVETVAYSPEALNRGLVYSLPLTKLKVTITYTVVTARDAGDGTSAPLAVAAHVLKPVRVETFTEPDRRNTFVLSGDGLVNDVRLDSSFKFSLTANQLLSGVTAEATDKTGEAIKSLVGAALTVAKGAALLKGRLPAAATTEERDVAYSVTFGLREMSWTGSGWRKEIRAPAYRLDGGLAEGAVPAVVVEVRAGAAEHANSEVAFVPKPGEKTGVLYRGPVPLVTRVSLLGHDDALLEETIGFSDAGPINSLEARYKAFSKRKTTIVFNPATGAVCEYGVEATSPAEASAKSLDESLAKIKADLAEIRKALAAAAAPAPPQPTTGVELDAKRKLGETEAALVAAQKELEQLRAGRKAK